MRTNLCSRFKIPAAMVALALCLTPAAAPDVWDKKTHVRFWEPVEFPGGVVVPAGGYVMKLANSITSRNIVHVTNAEENHVYATVLTLPTQRSTPAEKTNLTFYETPRGDPQFIHKWFYPGDTLGREFPYPRGRTHYIARATSFAGPAAGSDYEAAAPSEAQPVETAPSVEPAPEPEPAPVPEAATSAPDPAPEPAPEPQAETAPAASAGQRSEPALAESKPEAEGKLPATDSLLSEVALAGGLFMFTALVLTISRRVALRKPLDPPQEQ